ncbi:MAG: phosphoglycerate kinase [Nanoarchaeota archaeon]|nr:phosphoglycerate kinase [Nanoarchaeota archaeon]
MKTLSTMKLTGKRVFLRVDFNVPLKGTKITDDLRIQNALPTIRKILAAKPEQLIIATHLGRPEPGKGSAGLLPYSLAPVAKHLSKLLKKTIYFHANALAPIESKDKIVLLENLRFYDGEKNGSLSFAKTLASHADIYIDDAFGTAHRKDASVYALAKLLPSGIGLLMEQELRYVSLDHKRPIVAIFGAAKIKDKLPLFKKLLAKVDKLILGGGVVFTFLKAGGIEVGKSLVEEEMVSEARTLLKKYAGKIVFPTDFVGSTPASFKNWIKLSATEKKAALKTVPVEAIPKTLACYDVGPKSVKLFTAVLKNAKTVVWNGPLGVFEVKPYDASTNKLVKIIAESKITSIVGGGDTASAVRKTKYANRFTHISTGGGASLELLAGNKLPAIEVLKR